MKKIEKFISHTAVYTVVITLLFMLFAKMNGATDLAVQPIRFILILVFGAVITASEYVFKISKLHKMFAYIINYSVLLVAFLLIFVFTGKPASSVTAYIFASIIIFSIAYLAAVLTVFLVKRATKKTDEKNNKSKKVKYTNRFGNRK